MTDNVRYFDGVPNSNNMVLDSRWFNEVGIVLVEDQVTTKTMCYIGVGGGKSKRADEIQIAQWGCKVPKATAESLFGTLKDYKIG